MLDNNEYRGFTHALKRIYTEEGFLGLYRGYSAYLLAVRAIKIRVIIFV